MPIGWVAAAGVAGAAIGAYGAQSAASTQANAADNATNLQQYMFNQGQANLEPYKQAGTVGLNALSSAMFNPDGSINTGSILNKPFTAADYQASPGYAFEKSQGIDAIMNSAAGSGLTGNTLKQLDTFGTGLANQDFQQAYQNYLQQQQTLYGRLSGFVNTGANAAGGIANLGANFGQQAGSNMIGAGNAMAAGQVGSANALSGGINNGMQNYLLMQYMQGMGGGGASTLGSSSITPGGFGQVDYGLGGGSSGLIVP